MDDLNSRPESPAVSEKGANKTNLNNFFAGLDNRLQKDILNPAYFVDSQNPVVGVDTASVDIANKNMPLFSDGENRQSITNLFNNADALNAFRQNNQEIRSSRSFNEQESIFSRIEKREGSGTMDSGQSGGTFPGGADMRENQLGMIREKPASSVLPSYVTKQVSKSIVRAFSRGDSEIRLQLKPAELGRIFMTVDTHGDTIKVSIVTENQAAKELLAGNANDLKSALAASGIKIEQFDVEMGSDFKQSMADSNGRFNGSNSSGSRSNRGRGADTDASSMDEIENAEISGVLNTEDRALHFVA